MTPERAIGLRLADWADLTDLVDVRIHAMKLPQSPTLPAVRLALVGEPKTYHLRGVNSMTRARIQVDTYVDETPATDVDPEDQLDAVAAAADAALSGKTFTVGTPAVIRITGVLAIGERRKLPETHDELRLLRSSQDYIVWSAPVGS
jgi:hypothetical protein